MKKKLITALVIVLCVAVAAGGITMVLNKNKYKNSTLGSVRYSYGGDMTGSYNAISLSGDEGDTALLIFEGKEHHAARMVTTTYEVPMEELEKVKAMMLEYDQYAGSKRPRSKIYALDAGTSTLSFYFNEGGSFSLNDNLNLTKKQNEGFWAIRDYLQSLAQGREPVSQEIEERELGLIVDGYTEIFKIRDGVTEEDLEMLAGEHEITSYSNNEKIFYPEEKLDVSGLKLAGPGGAGTLAYYEPWGDVVIYYGDFEPAPGLYELGNLETVYNSTIELLAGMEGTYTFYVNIE